ncbi:uncharacterized protein LOC111633838 [Centruroides sculpturatus]|uniref:uncharacterized protein LOC111633838 n=1 Tax=Centruroides sculpturatus TaxID=218467 RepID=UPI000C6CC44F|nr:uncharacterized protein LOC111633838 [Centruroides sculpturatus]
MDACTNMSSSAEKEIIEFYRSNPHLWNPSHADYYKKNKRDSTLTELRELLASKHGTNISSNKILSKKFKNMKDAYKRELSKLQKSKSSGVGTNNVHKIRFMYFNQMDYLRDYMQADENEDTISLITSLENDKCSQPIVTEANEFQELSFTVDQSMQPNTSASSHASMNSGSRSVTPTSNSQWFNPHPTDDGVTVGGQDKKRKRQKTSHVSSSSLRSELYKRAIDYLVTKPNNPPACVEQNFGNHVALSLMNISKDLREEAKYEIQGILLKYYKQSRTNS